MAGYQPLGAQGRAKEVKRQGKVYNSESLVARYIYNLVTSWPRVSFIYICVFSQVLDVGWPGQHAPSLHLLCSICKSIENWLNTHSEHALLLHCRVNAQPSAFLFPPHPSLTDLVPTSVFRSYH